MYKQSEYGPVFVCKNSSKKPFNPWKIGQHSEIEQKSHGFELVLSLVERVNVLFFGRFSTSQPKNGHQITEIQRELARTPQKMGLKGTQKCA